MISTRIGLFVTTRASERLCSWPAVSRTMTLMATRASPEYCSRPTSAAGKANANDAAPLASVRAVTVWITVGCTSVTVTSTSTSPPATGWPKK
jgi:hypothetical protein